MSDFKNQMVNTINNDSRWLLLEKLYNKHRNRTDFTEIIPKTIHQIWLGSEFPSKYDELRNKMMSINSIWEYKLWTDKDVDEFGLKNYLYKYDI